MYTKKQLEEIAAPYFTKDITTLYASEDGNVFYGQGYAEAHASRTKTKVFELTGEEPAKPSKKTDK